MDGHTTSINRHIDPTIASGRTFKGKICIIKKLRANVRGKDSPSMAPFNKHQ